jgi:tripartite-type tricarboxylate transporter receptor subunit TctC
MDRRCLMAAVAAVLLPGGAARAADYPARPIELIVPASAGGGTDVMARAFAEAARKHVDQPLIVIDRPGASGSVGLSEVLRAAPDGYKVGVLISELAIIGQLNIVRFTVDDFVPIARLNADPASVTVRADAPWQTIDDFLAHARKHPTRVTMGDAGSGSIWHLAAAALENRAGVRFSYTPFQGSAPGVRALLDGQIDAMTTSPGEVAVHVASGKFRTLAVMADQRQPGLFAGVPTLKEKGVELSIGTWRGLGLPPNAPPEVVAVLRDLARKVAGDPAFRDAMAKAYLTVAYQDAAAFRQSMTESAHLFGKLLRQVETKQ